jgi:hypothetical protein
VIDPTPQLPQPPDSCINHVDCDVVDACCRGDAGGKRIAIRKDAVADFMVEREQRCAGVMCAQVTSIDPSCTPSSCAATSAAAASSRARGSSGKACAPRPRIDRAGPVGDARCDGGPS